MKPVEVRFDETAYKEYKKLKKTVSKNKSSREKPTHEQLLSSINRAIEKLKVAPFSGNLVQRKKITKKAITKYGTDKLFRMELVGYWRLLYTVIGCEDKIIVLIFEYMSHEKYNIIFGYKKNKTLFLNRQKHSFTRHL